MTSRRPGPPPGPGPVSSPEDLLALASSLSPLHLRLLDEVAALVHFPDPGAVPDVLVPFSAAFHSLHDEARRAWSDRDYLEVVGWFEVVLDLSPGREFAQSYLQRLVVSISSGNAATTDALLEPFRLVAAVPEEWVPVVLEALPALGLERALSLPVVAG